MVDLTESGETGGAGERWAHSPSNQSFQAYGFAPIRQVDPRAAEETLQLVFWRQLHSSYDIPEQETAVQLPGQTIQLVGSPAQFTVFVRSREDGRFALVLPSGTYRSAPPNEFRIIVRPLLTTCAKVVVDESNDTINGASQTCPTTENQHWAAPLQDPASGISNSLHGLLLVTEPTTVSLPLDL
jgi:hypothetical protein